MVETHRHPEHRSSQTLTAGFTLVELLTVLAIIAVLATLLMTTFGSVKRRAREAVCMSNLRQIGIGLHLYLDDFRKRPADLVMLATSKYCGDGRILSCPADRTAKALLTASGPAVTGEFTPQADNASPRFPVSYQHPLTWSDEEWERLMQAGTRAGVVVCTWHDVRLGMRGAAPALDASQRLILRGQLDGTVVRRQLVPPSATAVNEDTKGATSELVPSRQAVTPVSNASSPPWYFFSDEPSP